MANNLAKKKRWNLFLLYLGTMILLILFALFAAYKTRPVIPTGEKTFLDLLTTMFIIAVFLERALEVFVGGWRVIGESDFRETISDKELEFKAETDTTKKSSLEAELADLNEKFRRFQLNTQRRTYITGLFAGVLIAIVGVRVIEPLLFLTFGQAMAGLPQIHLLQAVDILLTGGVIGGGADGLHKIISVVTDFLEQTRKDIKNKS